MRTVTCMACLVLALAAGCSRSERRAAGSDAISSTTATGDGDERVVDPFCGMELKRGEAAASAVWNGTTWWFCLEDHRDAFLADPEAALRRTARPPADGG